MNHIASDPDFFAALYRVDRAVEEESCAFIGANRVLGVDGVYGKELVDVGEDLFVLSPTAVEMGLKAKRNKVFAVFAQ